MNFKICTEWDLVIGTMKSSEKYFAHSEQKMKRRDWIFEFNHLDTSIDEESIKTLKDSVSKSFTNHTKLKLLWLTFFRTVPSVRVWLLNEWLSIQSVVLGSGILIKTLSELEKYHT